MTELNPDLIERAAKALWDEPGWEQAAHEQRQHHREAAERALSTVADDIRAEGRREVFDALRAFRDEADKPLAVDLGNMIRAWLDEREGISHG